MSEVTATTSVTDAQAKRIAALVGATPVTMYRLANVLSEVLGRRVREQQMYNYRTNRLIAVNGAGRVEPATAIAFVTKQLAKQSAK
jgi:hypothetical protein